MVDTLEPPHPASPEVPCVTCGGPAEWLVTAPYGAPHLGGPGRILVYCTAHRSSAPFVLVSIPLSMVTAEVFVSLYEQGLSHSDPHIATELVFGTPRPDVVSKALDFLSSVPPG